MNDHDLVHVLYSDYGATHFLINHTQCPASVYAEDTVPMETGCVFFREKLLIDGEAVPLFNLHNYLIQLFHFTTDIESRLVILTPLSFLSKETLSNLQDGPLSDLEAYRRIGIRISSETTIKKISLDELEPHSRILASRLKRGGLPATHPLEKSMGYLIDLDRIIAETAQRSSREFEDGEFR